LEETNSLLQTTLKDKMFCLNKKTDDTIFVNSLNFIEFLGKLKEKSKKL